MVCTSLDLLLSSCSCQLRAIELADEARRQLGCCKLILLEHTTFFFIFFFFLLKRNTHHSRVHKSVLCCDPYGWPEDKGTQNGQHEVNFHSVFLGRGLFIY